MQQSYKWIGLNELWFDLTILRTGDFLSHYNIKQRLRGIKIIYKCLSSIDSGQLW